MSTSQTLDPSEPDPLRDPHRIAAARRLFVEVHGPAAFDRLSALAARILNAGHAKVTLFTDQDTVVGGFGLPPGVIGGPALLTGALSAIVVRNRAPLSLADARDDERVADLPAVTSGQVRAYLGSPLVAASGHVVGALTVYDPEPRNWTSDETELLQQLASSVVAELELSAARSAVGTSVTRLNVALEASSIGTWERDLRTGVIDWDERCAALFGLDGAVQFESDAAMEGRFVHRDDAGPMQEAMQRAIEENGQFTAEFRALTVDGTVRWMVARGRLVSDSRGEPVRLLGTILDVTDTRRQAAQRLSAMHRATAIAEVAAELANAARMEDLPEIVQRGATVLGAQSSALAIFDPDNGPLRLHMTNRLTDEVQVHVEYPVAGLEIELDETQPTQYAAIHGRRVLLADPEEAFARFPAVREGFEVLGLRALAALPLRVEGRSLGSWVALWATDHPVRLGRRRGPRGARRPDRPERLAPAGRRRAGLGRHRDGRGEPAAADARGGGPDPLGDARDRRAGPRARRARRPCARRLVLAARDRRPGPAARDGQRPSRPVPERGGRGLRPADARLDDRRVLGAGRHQHGRPDGRADRRLGARGTGAARPGRP